MDNHSGISGYVASTLVLLTCQGHTPAAHHRHLQQHRLHQLSTIECLPPVLFLHLVLLPLNIVRLWEAVSATRATGDRTQADGAQTLGSDTTACGQSPVAFWSFFLSTPKTAHAT